MSRIIENMTRTELLRVAHELEESNIVLVRHNQDLQRQLDAAQDELERLCAEKIGPLKVAGAGGDVV